MSKPTREKVVPFLHRVRAQGIAQIARDHHIDPRTRIPLEVDRFRWRLRHGRKGQAIPVYVVGLQRSGTNMLLRSLQNSLETQVYNENDRKAFDRYALRGMEVIRRLVWASSRRAVVFKPLMDSDRVADLLDDPLMPRGGRALWAYRGFEGRVKSSLGQFADNNLQVLRAVASGKGAGMWQIRGLRPELLDLTRSLDVDQMNPESAAALMWYLRNTLFFELGLDGRADTMVVSYDRVLSQPEETLGAAAAFVGIAFTRRMGSHIERRPPAIRSPIAIQPSVRVLCEELQERLDRLAVEGAPAVSPVGAQP